MPYIVFYDHHFVHYSIEKLKTLLHIYYPS